MPFDANAAGLRYQVEAWSDVLPEMLGLAEAHWREVALNQDDVPLDMDWEMFAAFERAGQLLVVTARREAVLAGYLVVIVKGSLHNRSTVFAMFDLYYLKPEERSGWRGVGLFRAAERALRARGARVMHVGTKLGISAVTGQSLDIGRMLEFLGWWPAERTYRKILKGTD